MTPATPLYQHQRSLINHKNNHLMPHISKSDGYLFLTIWVSDARLFVSALATFQPLLRVFPRFYLYRKDALVLAVIHFSKL